LVLSTVNPIVMVSLVSVINI